MFVITSSWYSLLPQCSTEWTWTWNLFVRSQSMARILKHYIRLWHWWIILWLKLQWEFGFSNRLINELYIYVVCTRNKCIVCGWKCSFDKDNMYMQYRYTNTVEQHQTFFRTKMSSWKELFLNNKYFVV